ncbi:tubulin-tyrosine ligase family protein (macronuclear) [Tetrahymena thermophila SB210]|uniref:Tubulin-tyrosine ligase family protein n=1 Tax=Tetrahymena thermophila (strain SB210) TaxID=312017 RepID=Q22DK4_TETTS|nr:tubulin-tyrosine ligase family protein [Tetrahymena thermophila SB210]EAR83354.2 tubulin-tyrosine ligase family protein [Tetrahymena thermophila SB210]|eukprot:XP_001031017.2 tubulin-tyrosine ligase family protein [Tetrahymena thermophila SB210]
MKSEIVQWLVFLPVTQETRVQFPVSELFFQLEIKIINKQKISFQFIKNEYLKKITNQNEKQQSINQLLANFLIFNQIQKYVFSMKQKLFSFIVLSLAVLQFKISLSQEQQQSGSFEIKDWLSLYNKLQDDYFQSKDRIQHRHFLPRTYFYIPTSMRNINISGYHEPVFNQDFFNNSRLDYNGIYIQKSIQFGNIQYIKINKNEESINRLIKHSEEKNQVIMIQKYVDEEINLGESDQKYFVSCKYANGQLFTDINVKEIQEFKLVKEYDQGFKLIERIIAIQKYISKIMILEEQKSTGKNKNVILTLQIGFVEYKKQIKPFLKNILPIMEYTKTQYDKDFDQEKLHLINMNTIYCAKDRDFKLFKYDYDYRVKRIHIWCNREFVFHHTYYALHTDKYEVLPPHCRNLTQSKQQKDLSLKQSDIVFRRYINREVYFKKNVTQISYLPNSWVIDLKNTFAFLIKNFDDSNIIKNYKGLKQIPETFEINLSASYVNEEESQFFYNRTDYMWISKPIDMIGGKGIQIYNDSEKIINQILHLKSISHFRNRFERNGLLMFWKTHWIKLLENKVVKQNHLLYDQFKAILDIIKQKNYNEEVDQYIDSLKTNRTLITSNKNKKNRKIKEEKMIIQQYIQNPLLLHKRKFDLRSYVIIASADPYIVFFRHGYVRLTYNQYDKNDQDLMTHLVNTHIQKKHPLYQIDKDDSHWSMEKFEKVMREEHKVRLTSIQEKIYKKMKEMLTYIFLGSKELIGRKEGLFQIFGTDYMFDDEMNPYLIEINDFPWLQGGTSTHEVVCSETVFDFIELSHYANSQIVKGEDIDVKTLVSKCPKCEMLINELEDFHILQDYI